MIIDIRRYWRALFDQVRRDHEMAGRLLKMGLTPAKGETVQFKRPTGYDHVWNGTYASNDGAVRFERLPDVGRFFPIRTTMEIYLYG